MARTQNAKLFSSFGHQVPSNRVTSSPKKAPQVGRQVHSPQSSTNTSSAVTSLVEAVVVHLLPPSVATSANNDHSSYGHDRAPHVQTSLSGHTLYRYQCDRVAPRTHGTAYLAKPKLRATWRMIRLPHV